MTVEHEKDLAACAAAELVQDGMTVGLGTGSTVAYLIPALAARLLRITCVATSPATATLAAVHGLAVLAFDQLARLDLAIDGADQIDPQGWLVKGGGGAHTARRSWPRRPIVSSSSPRRTSWSIACSRPFHSSCCTSVSTPRCALWVVPPWSDRGRRRPLTVACWLTTPDWLTTRPRCQPVWHPSRAWSPTACSLHHWCTRYWSAGAIGSSNGRPFAPSSWSGGLNGRATSMSSRLAVAREDRSA